MITFRFEMPQAADLREQRLTVRVNNELCPARIVDAYRHANGSLELTIEVDEAGYPVGMATK